MKTFMRFPLLFPLYLLTAFFWGRESHGASDITDFHHMDMCHSFEGPIAAHLEHIVKKFNAISPKVQVALKFSGQNIDAYDKVFGAQGGESQPILIWVPTDKKEKMLEKKEAYIPLNDLMRVRAQDFISAVFDAGTAQKTLVSLPLAVTTTVLFYNKKAFKEAGLNPRTPPATWEELEEALIKLKKVGYKGIAITDSPVATLRHFSALHNLPLGQGKENTLLEVSTTLQTKPFHNFLKRLTKWQKEGIYLKGTTSDLHDQFVQGKVAILLTDAHHQEMLINNINKQDKSFKVGVNAYPYSQSIVARPYAIDVQGDSLWVLSGPETSKKEAALFLKYLMSPEVQAEWHEKTTFLPLTKSAYGHSKRAKFYYNHPVHKTVCRQVFDRPTIVQRKITLSDSDTVKLNQGIEEILQGNDLTTTLDSLKN